MQASLCWWISECFWRAGEGENEQHEKAKAETGTSAGLGVGVQVRGIMGEKVLLLIAALELWPALWNTKDRSDTLQWLGLVNICPTSGMPRFLLTSPTNLNPDPHIHCTFNSLSSAFYSPGEATGRHTHTCVHAPHAMHVGGYLVTAANEILALSFSPPVVRVT